MFSVRREIDLAARLLRRAAWLRRAQDDGEDPTTEQEVQEEEPESADGQMDGGGPDEAPAEGGDPAQDEEEPVDEGDEEALEEEREGEAGDAEPPEPESLVSYWMLRRYELADELAGLLDADDVMQDDMFFDDLFTALDVPAWGVVSVNTYGKRLKVALLLHDEREAQRRNGGNLGLLDSATMKFNPNKALEEVAAEVDAALDRMLARN